MGDTVLINNLYNDKIYNKDVERIAKINLKWELFEGTSILISGGTGLIGSFFIDVLLSKKLNCKIYVLTRNINKARNRFSKYANSGDIFFVEYDASKLINLKVSKIDYILHLASNTHPLLYATEPISTIKTNIIGLDNILEFAFEHNAKRVLFASSVEIYGENRGDVDRFDESYCGYINSNSLRSGYPEAKRCCESLCQAYIKEKNLDIVIPRISRVFGPTLLESDSKALSQFIRKAVNKEDIVLKSEGKQFYSYLYVADVVLALLYIILCGKNGEEYNISDESGDITLKDLAQMIAAIVNKKVVFDLPSQTEKQGYSTATKAIMNSSKLKSMGWRPVFDFKEALEHTIQIMRNMK